MINVTGVNLVKFAQSVYSLSKPQGLGFLHFEEGNLSEEDAKKLLEYFKDDSQIALDMDYIMGRSCKMTVNRLNGKLVIDDKWYDHTNSQLKQLLSDVGIDANPIGEHNLSCECQTCKEKRF